jgi:hypothetical protein
MNIARDKDRKLIPEWRSWATAKMRCFNEVNQNYKYYGGRGITMCEEWRTSFKVFLRDMGPRPAGTTLDRIDTNGNYEPSNCRWATKRQQHDNRRDNRNLTHNGETKILSEWARHAGILPSTLGRRLTAGWSMERALEKPNPNRVIPNQFQEGHPFYPKRVTA